MNDDPVLKQCPLENYCCLLGQKAVSANGANQKDPWFFNLSIFQLIMRFKTFRLTLFIVLSVLFCTVIIGLFLVNHAPAINLFSAFLQQYSSTFCIWRYTILALLILFWPIFIRALGKWQQWPFSTIHLLIRLRWRMAVFLLVFELLITANTLPNLINYF